jgi:hypothetical protein
MMINKAVLVASMTPAMPPLPTDHRFDQRVIARLMSEYTERFMHALMVTMRDASPSPSRLMCSAEALYALVNEVVGSVVGNKRVPSAFVPVAIPPPPPPTPLKLPPLVAMKTISHPRQRQHCRHPQHVAGDDDDDDDDDDAATKHDSAVVSVVHRNKRIRAPTPVKMIL